MGPTLGPDPGAVAARCGVASSIHRFHHLLVAACTSCKTWTVQRYLSPHHYRIVFVIADIAEKFAHTTDGVV